MPMDHPLPPTIPKGPTADASLLTDDRNKTNLFYKTASAIPLVMLQGFSCAYVYSLMSRRCYWSVKMSSINLSRSSLRLFFRIAWKIGDSFSSLKHPWCICIFTLSSQVLFNFPMTFFVTLNCVCGSPVNSLHLPRRLLFYSVFFVFEVSIADLSSSFLYIVLGFWGCTMPRSVRASAWQLQRDYAPFCSSIPVHLFYSPPV